jgi:phosphosulfolactate synthase (CoM biosynthesis protein A)
MSLHTPMGKRYLQDILETMGNWVNTLKFAVGSFSLMPWQAVKEHWIGKLHSEACDTVYGMCRVK